eukprot:gene10498-22063_t
MLRQEAVVLYCSEPLGPLVMNFPQHKDMPVVAKKLMGNNELAKKLVAIDDVSECDADKATCSIPDLLAQPDLTVHDVLNRLGDFYALDDATTASHYTRCRDKQGHAMKVSPWRGSIFAGGWADPQRMISSVPPIAAGTKMPYVSPQKCQQIGELHVCDVPCGQAAQLLDLNDHT